MYEFCMWFNGNEFDLMAAGSESWNTKMKFMQEIRLLSFWVPFPNTH